MTITRRRFLSNSVLGAIYGSLTFDASFSFADTNEPLRWHNWSGALTAHPTGRFSPKDEAALARFFKTTTGPVRPVGSGHSFTPLVPTSGELIVADQLSGLIDHDPKALTATFGAGTRLGDIGPQLDAIGQGIFNLPDIDRQTLAGATSTATHGTGIKFKCLSAYITEMRLVTPTGEQLDIKPNSELFNAARVSVGSLGVISQITLQNRTPYKLKQRSWVEPTEDILSRFGEQASKHRHFELFPFTHSDYSMALATDETDEATNNPPPSPEEQAAFDDAMKGWMSVAPEDRRPLINGMAEMITPSERVDESYKILSNVRTNRFNEMEYSVPLSSGAECLREILATIRDKKIDVVFPLEYRYVSRDDTWLSMSSGHEDHAAISVHRIASEDYRPYFDIIEPIFWKYGGRPHWGKVHTLGTAQLEKLYPQFNAFQQLRTQIDPKGRMLNDHLRKLFGVMA